MKPKSPAPANVIQRMIKAMGRSTPRPANRGSVQDLPAAGQRSGQGAASVEPFLDQDRSTRPGPLE